MKKFLLIFMTFVMLITFALQSAAVSETIDGIRYKDGEKYTGWTISKSTENRYYYKDGKRVNGIQVIKGSRCVFDDKGIYLFKRTNLNERFSVIFENDYNIRLKDGNISFEIKVNYPKGMAYEFFSSGEFFELYKYIDEKWKKIPYSPYFPRTEAARVANEDFTMSYTMPFSYFNYLFEPGLYRVKLKLDTGEYDENWRPLSVTVRGEFNLVTL